MPQEPYPSDWALGNILGTFVGPEFEYFNPEFEYFNPEFEYFNPESDDSYPKYEGFSSVMMASNTRATNTMPTMKPLNVKDRLVSDWDGDEWKFGPNLSRSQAESSNSPKMAEK